MTAPNLPFRPEAPIVPELAAGVVLRHATRVEVFLLHHREEDRWCLPKGHVDPGESLRATAFRETREETGFQDVRLKDPELGEVSYRFFRPSGGLNVYKTVVYFLASTPERVPKLESTFDRAEWASLATAIERVPYETDRRMLETARARLRLR